MYMMYDKHSVIFFPQLPLMMLRRHSSSNPAFLWLSCEQGVYHDMMVKIEEYFNSAHTVALDEHMYVLLVMEPNDCVVWQKL